MKENEVLQAICDYLSINITSSGGTTISQSLTRQETVSGECPNTQSTE